MLLVAHELIILMVKLVFSISMTLILTSPKNPTASNFSMPSVTQNTSVKMAKFLQVPHHSSTCHSKILQHSATMQEQVGILR